MVQRFIDFGIRAALLLAASASLAHAHHLMGFATPATAWEGFASGIAHPVIGFDHLLFIVAAGVLAAGLRRGALLPLVFVAASCSAVALRTAGGWEMGEIWVAGSLVAAGALLLLTRNPGRLPVAILFLLAGAIHGYALAEGMVGAERTPLYAYLIGLTVIQYVIALAAWRVATWCAARRPHLPVKPLAGAVVSAAGLAFAVLAVL